MKDYLRKLEKLNHYSRGHGDVPRTIKRFKKLLIIFVAFLAVGFISLVILAIVGLVWLFNRGDNIKSTSEGAVQQLQIPSNPLNVESYITNGQVDTERLRQTYNALPAQLQDEWLRQLNVQIQELQNKAGVSSETIRALTSLYDALNQN